MHRVRPVLVVLALLTVLPGTDRVHAQEEAFATLQGFVTRGGDPVAGQPVILHRVSSELAGEIDTVATTSDGAFRFVLPHVPDPEARREVFFASARYSGILYFGAPVTTVADLDSTYVLEVHDTVSAPEHGATFPVQVRNIFIEQTGDGWSVTDLFEIRNEGDRTVVTRTGGSVWTYPLFPGAANVQLGDGDANPDAFTFVDGMARITSPVPPGTRLFVFRYSVPDLEVAVALPGTTERLDLLIREPASPVAIEGLTANQPVEVEPGSVYRRYGGENLQEAFVRFTPAEEAPGIQFGWLLVGLALVLAVLGLWANRKPVPVNRTELVLAIAKLDEDWDGTADPSEPERRRYERRRARLLSRLPRS